MVDAVALPQPCETSDLILSSFESCPPKNGSQEEFVPNASRADREAVQNRCRTSQNGPQTAHHDLWSEPRTETKD